MNTTKSYRLLSIVSLSVGIGMFLGHSLGQGTVNTPLWIGGILILLGAVLLGMSLSTPQSKKKQVDNSSQIDEQ